MPASTPRPASTATRVFGRDRAPAAPASPSTRWRSGAWPRGRAATGRPIRRGQGHDPQCSHAGEGSPAVSTAPTWLALLPPGGAVSYVDAMPELARRNACPAVRPRRRRPPRHGLLHRRPRPRGRRPAGRVRHQRAPRHQSLKTSFNETHIVATTQAICDYRADAGVRRPAVPRPRHPRPVRAGLGVRDRGAGRQRRDRPGRLARRLHADAGRVARDPARQRAGRQPGASGLADGIVVTPSHNPPSDGGFKYNPPHGGPADTDATSVIAERANELIRGGLAEVKRVPFARARAACTAYDFLGTYVDDLPVGASTSTRSSAAGVRIGADPLGWSVGGVLGRDRRAARPRPDRGEPPGGCHVEVHDPRLGREDPDGLLVAVGDGVADRTARTSTRSRPATTPTPTGTASSRRTPG